MEFSQYNVNALLQYTNRPSLVFTRGRGMILTDHDGRDYLDFMQGWAVNTFGHAPQLIADALAAQAGLVINASPAFFNEPSIALADLLVEHSCFDRVFFGSSGAEVNESALKLARKWGKLHPNAAGERRYEVITFEGGFHGRTLAMMSACGKPGWDTIFAPQVPGFVKARLNDIASVEALISDKTVAVMLEPIQGEGGVIPASREFMQQLRELTTKHNLLLIVDEVQSGCGRAGTLFAYELSGIEPDVMTLAKGIGSGVPLGALLCKKHVEVFEAGDQGGTYNGNPLMTAAGYSVISQLTAPGFLEGVKARGEYLRTKLLELSDERGFEGERGEGLLRALLLGKDIGNQIVEKARLMQPDGLLLNAARPNLLRFMPALNVTTQEIDQMMSMLRSILETL